MNRTLALAVVVSLLIHVALLIWAPKWDEKIEPTPVPIVATIDAAPAAQPSSAPPAPPTQQAPEVKAPPRAEPDQPQVERKRRAERTPERAARAPRERTPSAPAESSPAPSAEADRSTAMSAQTAPPVFGAGSPDAAQDAGTLAQPSGPATGDNAIDAYRAAIYAAAGRYRDYPRYARAREWEGRAVVRLEIDSGGRAQRIVIATSSGHEVLDRSALDMVRQAQRDVPVPPALRGRAFNVDVAILYELKD